MDEKLKISESEWQIMKIIWGNDPLSANEIIEQLSGVSTWKPKTIKTLLNRLLSKEILGYEKIGKKYIYYSKIAKDECIQMENESFLRKVYDGAIKNMLASFLENHNLSSEEIKDLKNILNEKSSED